MRKNRMTTNALPKPTTTDTGFQPSLRGRALTLVIALGLALGFFCQILFVAPIVPDSAYTFQRLEQTEVQRLVQAWAPRVASLYLSNTWLTGVDALIQSAGIEMEPETRTAVGMASWCAGWFFLISLVWIWRYKFHSLFFLFATYACMTFAYMPRIDFKVYAWDIPALFFATLFVAVFTRKKDTAAYVWGLAALIWLGISFKETAIVFFVFPLLMPRWTWSKRLALCGGVALVGLGIKYGLTYLANHSFTSVMAGGPNADSFWRLNLRLLVTRPLLLANAGSLLALFLVPSKNQTVLLFKGIAILFTLNIFIFGIATEYRIWFEMIPLSLYALYAWFWGDDPAAAANENRPAIPNSGPV